MSTSAPGPSPLAMPSTWDLVASAYPFVHVFPASSTDELLGSLERTCAPLALLKRSMADAWGAVREPLRARLLALLHDSSGRLAYCGRRSRDSSRRRSAVLRCDVALPRLGRPSGPAPPSLPQAVRRDAAAVSTPSLRRSVRRSHAVVLERVGGGPHELAMPAWLGVGTR